MSWFVSFYRDRDVESNPSFKSNVSNSLNVGVRTLLVEELEIYIFPINFRARNEREETYFEKSGERTKHTHVSLAQDSLQD
jgi:hypothetical protein